MNRGGELRPGSALLHVAGHVCAVFHAAGHENRNVPARLVPEGGDGGQDLTQEVGKGGGRVQILPGEAQMPPASGPSKIRKSGMRP